ncbi:MAG: hypothetical protein Q9193_002407, partial [Seirophora villosa]
ACTRACLNDYGADICLPRFKFAVMQCNICQRPSGTRLPLNCTTCARDALYQTRLRLAHTLLEHEVASGQIEDVLKQSRPLSSKDSLSTLSTGDSSHASVLLKSTVAERNALEERTLSVHDHIKNLRTHITKTRKEIASYRASNAKRKSSLDAARQELARREAVEVPPIVDVISRTQTRWDALHAKTAESRLLLCREAASLYGLRRRSKSSTRPKKDGYLIGWLPIYHLRDFDSASPDVVTTVNSILAHLVHLLSHYLSLRLPAEITLPYPDHPNPTIFPPVSSYTRYGSHFPNAKYLHSASSSPVASRATMTNQSPKPRLLSLKKQLSLLAKDEPQTYASVVEGTTLLAWDIAWLCQTQGINVGEDVGEDVCNIGRNLWRLATVEQTGLKPMSPVKGGRAKQGLNADSNQPVNATLQLRQQSGKATVPTAFGHWSHGTTHSNLAGATGSERMRTWRLQDASRVIGRVKHMLVSDRASAGWEMLEGKEWETASMNPRGATPATVEDASEDSTAGQTNKVQDANSDQVLPTAESSQDKTKGTSGWTKLKSR